LREARDMELIHSIKSDYGRIEMYKHNCKQYECCMIKSDYGRIESSYISNFSSVLPSRDKIRLW